jgi:hypothetical protein
MSIASDKADDAAADRQAASDKAAGTKAKAKGPLFHVVKPFTFTYSGNPQVRDPVTGKITAHAEAGYAKDFAVGDNQEMTPEMVDHPWILGGADGSIETDAQRDARVREEKAVAARPAAVVPAPAPSAATETAPTRR